MAGALPALSSGMARWLKYVAYGLLGAGFADAAAPADFSLVARSRHVALYAWQGPAPNVAEIERRLLHMAALLGEPEIPQLEYFHYDHPADLAAATGLYIGGLTLVRAGQIHSTRRQTDHEMVHLLAGRLGDPGQFFQEGLAVALGDRGRDRDGHAVDAVARRIVRSTPLDAWLVGFDPLQRPGGYSVAGSFVGFLLKRHGVSRVVSFFRMCRMRTRNEAFVFTFGERLEDAAKAWVGALEGRRR